MNMFSETVSTVTNGVRVSVRTTYLKEESSPLHDHYVFAYQVRIYNESPYRIKLMRRKWFITDGLGRKRMVSGEGVIGKQPELAPGEMHEYVSGCNFETPIGKMEGYYSMLRTADQSDFKVRIPSFTMVLPFSLN